MYAICQALFAKKGVKLYARKIRTQMLMKSTPDGIRTTFIAVLLLSNHSDYELKKDRYRQQRGSNTY
jgi:hypothetical protein